MDVWLFEYDGEVDLSNATTDEVAQVAWMDRKQIKELFDADMFVDTMEIMPDVPVHLVQFAGIEMGNVLITQFFAG